MSSNLKSRISKLESKVMKGNIFDQILVKHGRLDGWGMPRDKWVQLEVFLALAFKEDPSHPKYDTAISILEWASTRTHLELIDRAERMWTDRAAAGEIPEPPSPWNAGPADPSEVMPLLPFYMTREQWERSYKGAKLPSMFSA